MTAIPNQHLPPAQPDRPIYRPREPDTVCTIGGPCPCDWPCEIAVLNWTRLEELRDELAKAYAASPVPGTQT